MIAIIDYGLGNVFAFRNVYERLNIAVTMARTAADLAAADKVILPGVGAFDHAMDRLDASGLRGALEQFAMVEKRPILGVCVGMQMLTESSEEGKRSGLGWVPGIVRRFDAGAVDLPHMGWNDVEALHQDDLFRDMNGPRFYFLHSYFVECRDASDALAKASYGGAFSCAVSRENIFGVQFHPEKSHHWGTQLLKNFAEL